MEKKKGYSMFERDKLDPADSMRIERNIYFEEQTADLSGLTALPLEQLQALREEYAAAEQAAFEALQEQAAAWDEQAGKTLAIDKAIEYVHQQPPQLRTGKNRRTGKESLCRQGSYGKISEWAYQSLSAFIHRGIAAYPARVCRAFQSKRAAFTGLCYRGRGTGAAYR